MPLSPPLSLPLHPNLLLHDGFVWFYMHSGSAGKHFSDSVCLPMDAHYFVACNPLNSHPCTDLGNFVFCTFIFTTKLVAALTFWVFFSGVTK